MQRGGGHLQSSFYMVRQSPTPLTRVLVFGYIYALRKAHEAMEGWWVPPCAILQLCMLSVLSLHVPALWSGRVNLQRCITQLEQTIMYFSILHFMVVWWSDGSAVAYTTAALCLGWYVWSRISREWLPLPELMKTTLVLYFVGCVPLLWIQSPRPAVSHRPELYEFLCDISLVCFECTAHVYDRLWELMVNSP